MLSQERVLLPMLNAMVLVLALVEVLVLLMEMLWQLVLQVLLVVPRRAVRVEAVVLLLHFAELLLAVYSKEIHSQ